MDNALLRLGLYTHLEYVTHIRCNIILTLIEHCLLLDIGMSMCEMLSGICKLL